MFFKISMPKDVVAGEAAHIIVEAPDRDHAIFYAGAAFICGRDDELFAKEFTDISSTIAVEESTENALLARELTGAAVIYTCTECGLPELKVDSEDDMWEALLAEVIGAFMDTSAEVTGDEPASTAPASTEPVNTEQLLVDTEDPNPADL